MALQLDMQRPGLGKRYYEAAYPAPAAGAPGIAYPGLGMPEGREMALANAGITAELEAAPDDAARTAIVMKYQQQSPELGDAAVRILQARQDAERQSGAFNLFGAGGLLGTGYEPSATAAIPGPFGWLPQAAEAAIQPQGLPGDWNYLRAMFGGPQMPLGAPTVPREEPVPDLVPHPEQPGPLSYVPKYPELEAQIRARLGLPPRR